MRIEIGNKSYELKFTVNAMAELEDMTGQEIGNLLSGGQFKMLRYLMWAGLIENNPELTVKSAGALVEEYLQSGGALDVLGEALTKAIESAGFFKQAAKAQKK